MRIGLLREFIEFAKYQNVSAAARKLFITQPALSNHIATIEKELGVALVNRGQSLELNEAGKAFFEGCCEVVSLYDDLVERVTRLAGADAGILTIKADTSGELMSIRLLELVSEFRGAHPSVNVRFSDTDHDLVEDSLMNGTIDVALVYNYRTADAYDSQSGGFHSESDLCLVAFNQVETSVVAPADHPLMGMQAVRFEDIVPYPYAMPAGAQFRECETSVRELYARHGAVLKNIHYKVVDSISELILSQVKGLEMLIVGATPRLPGHMANRRFDPPVFSEECLIYRRDNTNPVLAEFVSFIQASVS